jgi:hypothetical protein
MSTTQTPGRLIIATVDRSGFDFDELREGQGLSMGATGLYRAHFERGDHDGLAEVVWEKEVVDPAIEEVLPQIRDLIASAIEKRLPWTWPGR